MKPATLKAIKNDIKSLNKVFQAVESTWNDNGTGFPSLKVIGVLLGNMAFEGSHCVNYNAEEAVTNISRSQEALKALREYYGEEMSIINWVCDEVDCIILAHMMSEDEDEQIEYSFNPYKWTVYHKDLSANTGSEFGSLEEAIRCFDRRGSGYILVQYIDGDFKNTAKTIKTK